MLRTPLIAVPSYTIQFGLFVQNLLPPVPSLTLIPSPFSWLLNLEHSSLYRFCLQITPPPNTIENLSVTDTVFLIFATVYFTILGIILPTATNVIQHDYITAVLSD